VTSDEATPSEGADPTKEGAAYEDLGSVVRVLGIGLTAFQVAVTYFWPLNPLLHYALFLAWVCALIYVVDATRVAGQEPGARLRRRGAWVGAVASGTAGLYFMSRFEWIVHRWPLVEALSFLDVACGVVFLLVILDTTRRTVGGVLVGVMAVFLGYMLFGHLTTGLFYHRPLGFGEVIDHLVFTDNGVFSAPLAVAATYVYVFVLFGTALEISGGGDFLFRAARALTGRTRGGPAKVSVISSGLYGSITGSPTANVMTTGLFTIPLMKRTGIRGEVAGAIESVASTGGALLPPVMGSAAFLMAELTGIPYLDILVAGTIPAALFYGGLFAQVHFGAAKQGLAPAEEAETSSALGVLREGVHHLVPLLVLTVLLVRGESPMTAAGVAIALTLVVSWRDPEKGIGPRKLLELFEVGARRSLLVTATCAAAGVVVGGIVTTGLGGKITSLIFSYAGGSIFLALLATMVVCIVLGMGMPVPSAYVVTAVLAGPPLILLGLSTTSAHLFILYFATVSAITPPVAVAAYAASGIADSDPNRTALQAVRLGIIAFVIPYFFVYRPELLLMGDPLATVVAVFTSAVGVLLVAGALEGYIRVPIPGWERVALLAGGLALIFPGVWSDLGGVLLALVVGRRQFGLVGGSRRTEAPNLSSRRRTDTVS